MRVVLLLALLTGCDKLFQLPHIDRVDAGGARDASAGDARSDAVDAPADTIQQTHSNCPTAFGLPYENSRYRYIPTQLTWYAALTYCRNLDDPTSTKRVHLPVITSDLERSHVYTNVVGSASRFWIGLSDTKTDGAYQWVTAEVVSYPEPGTWASGEPSTDPGDDCVLSRYSTTDLDSLACATPSELVCECDDYAYAPANYELM